MQKKVVILTSGHFHYDERIFWKFGRTLVKYNCSVVVSSSVSDHKEVKEGITIDSFDGIRMRKSDKVNRFISLLVNYSPDIVICCEPLTIIPASKYKKQHNHSAVIVSDITEWYPENTTIKMKGFKKVTTYLKLWLFNIYSIQFADGIIIGEEQKKKRYDIIAPGKKKEIVGYYPVLEFFPYSPPTFDGKSLTLCYAGLINYRRGILNLLEVCKLLTGKYPHIKLKLILAGKFELPEERSDFEKRTEEISTFEIIHYDWREYPLISGVLKDADICFDLREHNFVHNSLPIKIFEYMASGKPFIFTDIKPLRELFNTSMCGYLTEPEDYNSIINILEDYIKNPELLLKHSKNGRYLVENLFNWEKESSKLLNFLDSLSGK